MAIIPILFNTEMVQAILAGRKTQTRRLIKDIGEYFHQDGTQFRDSPIKTGDLLYVRETWVNLPVSPGGHTRLMRGMYYYKADVPDRRPDGWRGNWKPSIHMPKEAARIFLRVQDVRAERLKSITPFDAMDEGFTDWNDLQRGWESTIRKADIPRYGWFANPWVWRIVFERAEKPEGWEA